MNKFFKSLFSNRTGQIITLILLLFSGTLIAAKFIFFEAGKPNILIGGGVQGRPLHLRASVSTIAGDPGNFGMTDGGSGDVATFNSPHGITSDGMYLYVADTANDQIRKIEIATGIVTTIAGQYSAGEADGKGAEATFRNPTAIANDGTNLYVTDSDNHRIRKIVIATGVVSTLAGSHATYTSEPPDSKYVPGSDDGVGQAATFYYPYGIVTDGQNLFVTENNKIRKVEIATGMVTTLAGSGSRGNADGLGSAATFNQPRGIAIDSGKLYVADSGNNDIRIVDISTGLVSTESGTGYELISQGKGTDTLPFQPNGITIKNGALYVTDSANNKICQINLATHNVTILAGKNGTMDTSRSGGLMDGVGSEVFFNSPSGIVSVGDYLFVADTENQLIRKIKITTGMVNTFAGSGKNLEFSNGSGSMGKFNEPAGITFDGKNLYVADSWNHEIRKIQIANKVVTTTIAGSGMLGSKDGVGADASFNRPFGITTDGANIYVADTFNNKIRKIAIDTDIVTTFAGNGSAGSHNGVGTAASFNMPFGITTDGKNLFVADTGNDKIRKIDIATGLVSNLAGSGSSGEEDGKGDAAFFNGPEGITTDGENVYVADTHNHAIRKIVILSGVVSTLSGGKLKDEADKEKRGAMLSFPRGITTDGINLYVSNSQSRDILQISLSSGKRLVLAGTEQFGNIDGAGEQSTFSKPDGITSDGKSLFITDSMNHTIRKIQ